MTDLKPTEADIAAAREWASTKETPRTGAWYVAAERYLAGVLAERERAWQPIETAPKSEPLLLWVPLPDTAPVAWGTRLKIGSFVFGRWQYTDTDLSVAKYNPPTHWKPLPEPPSRGPQS